jgi:transposase InsO family protein
VRRAGGHGKRLVCLAQTSNLPTEARGCSVDSGNSQVFEEHQGRYGAPRIHKDLHDEGINCSRKRVARLMRAEELSASPKRCRVRTTKRDETHPVVPNILSRDFQAEEPNKQWGNRHYVHPNNARMAVCSRYFRFILQNGGGLVDVKQW